MDLLGKEGLHLRIKNQRILCACLVALNLVFIWGNSLLPGSVSGDMSSGVLAYIEEILGEYCHIGEFFLRKLAHFSEFAMLGLLLSWLFLLLRQEGIHRFTLPLLCGMIAACVDETIQVFSPQRGPSVIDVWIDTAGVTAGVLILLLGHFLFVKYHSNNGGNTK